MIIASDLHARKGSPLLVKNIENVLAEDKDKVLIIPGDVTQSGKKDEYARVARWFEQLISSGVRIVLTAGNHDISRRFEIISFIEKRYKERFGSLIDIISEQKSIVARKDHCDIVYKIGQDVFCALRSTHARHWKSSRIAKQQYRWAGEILKDNKLLTENGYRLHLVTHHSLWRSSGNDAHFHMHRKRRLVEDFLEPFGFVTAINGHNHRFDSGLRELKGYYIFHIQSPTLSTRTKGGRFSPGFAKWDPEQSLNIGIQEVSP